ncbi:uncharacterized protein (DUF305 family) [Devosia sp. UYZn731]|uniref:CopM family metallochaperone n=1 Tax=Devosia sp. UYZn731 TaxID=3156345 RepID=UPI0033959977
MLKTTFSATLIALGLGVAAPAFAQDMQPLPPECGVTSAVAPMAGMAMGDTAAPMDDAHKALMAGMDQMNTNMMAGAANTDLDVAFVCGMIPHHQGAITMAKAELQYGKDEWTKALAQKIITAQEKEIADMTKWLETHGK